MSESSTAPNSAPDTDGVTSAIPGLLFSVVAVIALGIAAAHAPPAFRLIGLFAATFGVCVGLIVATVAVATGSPRGMPVVLLSALLSLTGLAMTTGLNYRRYVDRLGDSQQWRKVELIASAIREEFPRGEDPERVRQMGGTFERAVAEKRRQAQFSYYLAQRLRAVGGFPPAVGVIWWILELFATASLSAWVAAAWSRRKRRPTSGPMERS